MLDPLKPTSLVQFRCKNPRFRFTDFALKALPYSDAHTYVWDTAFPTLGMRIGKRTKTFIVIKPGGKRITLGKYPFTSLSDARRRAAKLYGDAQTLPTAHSMSTLQAISTFFDTHVAKNRPKTQKDTIRLINKHFIPALASTAIDRITGQDITAITDAIRRTPAEAIKAHAAMSVFFRWAVRRKLIIQNPMQGLPLHAYPRSSGAIAWYMSPNKELGHDASNAGRSVA
jgi:integrase-like protein